MRRLGAPGGVPWRVALWALVPLLAACGEPEPISPLRFTDVTAEAGLAYTGPSYAAAAADFDRDGRPDLAVSHHGEVVLYHNQGGGRFRRSHALGWAAGDTHGLAWGDFDADGWPDLYIAKGAQRGEGKGNNRLLWNRRGEMFLATAIDEVLLDPRGRGRSACPTDFDGDGRLDLFVMNLVDPDRPQRLAVRRGAGFVDLAPETGWSTVRGEGVQVLHLDGEPHYLITTQGQPAGHLYRRGGDGRFRDVTEELGLWPNLGVSAAAVGDYDNDGDADLYFVGGQRIREDVRVEGGELVFRLLAGQPGQGKEFRFRAAGELEMELAVEGKYREGLISLGAARRPPPEEGEAPWRGPVEAPLLRGRPNLDPAVDRGLFLWREGDGTLVARFLGDEERRPRAASGVIHASGDLEVLAEEGLDHRPRSSPNFLFENHEGRFYDVTEKAGVGDPGPGTDALFADFDNDGDLDLFVLNGGGTLSNPPDVLYRNNGDGTFTDVTVEAGVAGPTVGRGDAALAFDYDGDGDLDLFVANGGGPPPAYEGPHVLWRNDTAAGRWLAIAPEGRRSHRDAQGLRVLAAFEGRQLALERMPMSGRFSASLLPLHLGLGRAREAEIDLIWPSGTRQKGIMTAGRVTRVVEPR